ncbi:MAG: tRNA uridine-5-carboxymethylaminomethyl(34) synthesis GTPase MnmE, partial [Acidobacteriota bacterium]
MAKDFSSGLSSDLSGGADTIVARATAAGAGALAVIRVSGPETRGLAGRLSPDINLGSPWRAKVVRLHGGGGAFLEEAVVIPYRAPKSYTGEDMLELMVHGSRWIVDAVVGTLISNGARQAAPGEFTRRAVANGKLDLVQAEAVNEVIQAETEWQARMAREQLHGALSQEFCALKGALVAFLAEVEGSLDFEEQGVAVDREAYEAARKGCVARIDALLVTVGVGVRVR